MDKFKINYLFTSIIIILVINLGWVIINNELNNTLREKLDNQKLRYEKLLAEKLLLEKISTRSKSQKNEVEIEGVSNDFKQKTSACRNLTFVNSELRTELKSKTDSIKAVLTEYKFLIDSIQNLRNNTSCLKIHPNLFDDQNLLKTTIND